MSLPSFVLYPAHCSSGTSNGTAARSGRHPRREVNLTPRNKPAIQATWCGRVIAESEQYEFIEGRFYFPHDAVDWSLVLPSGLIGHRNPWGKIKWFDLKANGLRRRKAAWAFHQLRRPYSQLNGYTTFWKGVVVAQTAKDPELQDLADECGESADEIIQWLST